MQRGKPLLAVAVDTSVGNPQNMLSYVSESGCFAKGGFKIGENGLVDSPEGQMSASTTRFVDLELGRVLGKGACSEVRLATHKETGKKYALKRFDVTDETRRKQLIMELRTLFGSRCPHLVSLHDAFYNKEQIHMMLEYMDAGTLEHMIATKSSPTEAQSAAIIKQVVAGLFSLHSLSRQIHRDLKPGNILLNSEGFVKISDFGYTKRVESEMQTLSFVGTLMYLSPERMKGESYGFVADIWSLGLIAYEIVHGVHPYKAEGKHFIELIQSVVENPEPTPDPARGYSENYSDFLRKCIVKDPRTRSAANALLDHPWIKTAGDETVVASWIS